MIQSFKRILTIGRKWFVYLLPRLFLAWLLLMMVLMILVVTYGRVDRAQAADVIVVLGAGLRPDNRPGPALIRRAGQAAVLWQQGLAPNIICTGGVPVRSTRSEASGCRDVLMDNGVPSDAIWLEEDSHSTEENALYTYEIMNAQGWQQAIVVSDGYHLLRATLLFRQQGIPNTTSPAIDPPFDNHLIYSVREVLALQWQAVKDILNLPFTYVPVF